MVMKVFHSPLGWALWLILVMLTSQAWAQGGDRCVILDLTGSARGTSGRAIAKKMALGLALREVAVLGRDPFYKQARKHKVYPGRKAKAAQMMKAAQAAQVSLVAYGTIKGERKGRTKVHVILMSAQDGKTMAERTWVITKGGFTSEQLDDMALVVRESLHLLNPPPPMEVLPPQSMSLEPMPLVQGGSVYEEAPYARPEPAYRREAMRAYGGFSLARSRYTRRLAAGTIPDPTSSLDNLDLFVNFHPGAVITLDIYPAAFFLKGSWLADLGLALDLSFAKFSASVNGRLGDENLSALRWTLRVGPRYRWNILKKPISPELRFGLAFLHWSEAVGASMYIPDRSAESFLAEVDIVLPLFTPRVAIQGRASFMAGSYGEGGDAPALQSSLLSGGETGPLLGIDIVARVYWIMVYGLTLDFSFLATYFTVSHQGGSVERSTQNILGMVFSLGYKL